ncbi:hypothetical protein TrVE_jg11441, partial [Triparma verrucosa]
YGYVTSCPSNLGTGMRASVHVKIPYLTADGTDKKAKEVCKPLGLSVRGTGGEHTPIGADGTVDISPSNRLFIKECEIISRLYEGIKLLMKEEKQQKESSAESRRRSSTVPTKVGGIMTARKSMTLDDLNLSDDEGSFSSKGGVIDSALEKKVDTGEIFRDSSGTSVEEDNPMAIARKRATTEQGQRRTTISSDDGTGRQSSNSVSSVGSPKPSPRGGRKMATKRGTYLDRLATTPGVSSPTSSVADRIAFMRKKEPVSPKAEVDDTQAKPRGSVAERVAAMKRRSIERDNREKLAAAAQDVEAKQEGESHPVRGSIQDRIKALQEKKDDGRENRSTSSARPSHSSASPSIAERIAKMKESTANIDATIAGGGGMRSSMASSITSTGSEAPSVMDEEPPPARKRSKEVLEIPSNIKALQNLPSDISEGTERGSSISSKGDITLGTASERDTESTRASAATVGRTSKNIGKLAGGLAGMDMKAMLGGRGPGPAGAVGMPGMMGARSAGRMSGTSGSEQPLEGGGGGDGKITHVQTSRAIMKKKRKPKSKGNSAGGKTSSQTEFEPLVSTVKGEEKKKGLFGRVK